MLLVLGTVLFRLPDPNGQQSGVPFWHRLLYASSAWTFGDSWATNIAAVGTAIGAALTAAGTLSDLLPGVELGRFSLLIAAAGAITVAAPLVFGTLNYPFARVDPTTAGIAVILLPEAAAVLRGRLLAKLPGRLGRYFEHGGELVTLAAATCRPQVSGTGWPGTPR